MKPRTFGDVAGLAASVRDAADSVAQWPTSRDAVAQLLQTCQEFLRQCGDLGEPAGLAGLATDGVRLRPSEAPDRAVPAPRRPRPGRCGRPTRADSLCGHPLARPRSGSVPYPLHLTSCRAHLTNEERARLRAAETIRPQGPWADRPGLCEQWLKAGRWCLGPASAPGGRRCGRHPTEDERRARAAGARQRHHGPDLPACWRWPLRPVTSYQQARDWHAGRCAVCGALAPLVDDHCHATGLLRGWLCRGCNGREGHRRDSLSVFCAYRYRPPAVLLGWTVPYGDPRRQSARPTAQVVAAFGERPDDPHAAARYLAHVAAGNVARQQGAAAV